MEKTHRSERECAFWIFMCIFWIIVFAIICIDGKKVMANEPEKIFSEKIENGVESASISFPQKNGRQNKTKRVYLPNKNIEMFLFGETSLNGEMVVKKIKLFPNTEKETTVIRDSVGARYGKPLFQKADEMLSSSSSDDIKNLTISLVEIYEKNKTDIKKQQKKPHY